MPNFETLRLLGRRNQKDAPVLGVSDSIIQITKDALDILVQGKGSPEAKRKRYRKEAERLLDLITSKLLEDPDFYRQVDPDVNMRALRLLNELVPKQKSEEFQSSPEHRVIAGYLNDLGKHNRLIPLEQNGGDSTSIYSDLAVRRIRSESRMPSYYLDNIFGENIGRPPERDKHSSNLPMKLSDFRGVLKERPEQ